MNTAFVSTAPCEQTGSVVPAITWLNMSGDGTITWDESNKDQILALVKAKMNEGYSFFVIKPRALSFLGNKTEALTNRSQLDDAIGVVVPDSQVSAIVKDLGDPAVNAVVQKGAAKLTLVPKATSINTTKRADSAEEVLKSQTVAVRPIVGG